jgi:hypothetical protein
MRTVRRSSVSRGTRARRKFIWARRSIVAAAVGANASVFSDLLASFQAMYGADVVGSTIVRIRGKVHHNFDYAVLAVRTMTQSTFATLGAANGPITDSGADWMGWVPLLTDSATAAAEGKIVEFDIKSNRKMEEVGQGLLLGFQNGTALAGAQFTADLSIGLMLP